MSGPLSGLRVVDFGQYIAGPLAAMILADCGADVVRVDPPGGPRWCHPANAALQRGKRSISLDLRSAGDAETAGRIVATSDVLIENFRPGVMDRLGLSPHEMLSANPRLVYCSMPGFGADDPRAGLSGWEGIVSAAAAVYRQPRMMPGTPEILFNAAPLVSAYAAIIASHAVVAALIAREQCGRGQHVEVPLFDAAHQIIGLFGLSVPMTPPRGITLNPALMKRRACADGRFIDISPPIRGFERFVDYFARPIDGDAADLVHRADPESFARLDALLDQVVSQYSAADLEREAQERAGAAVALCQTTHEWLHDRQALATQCVIPMDDPELGAGAQAGYAVHLTATPLSAAHARRLPDSDRNAILADVAAAHQADPSPPGPAPTLPLEGIRVIDTTQILAGPTAGKVLAEYGADVIKINDPRPDANPMGAAGHEDVNRGKRSLLLDLTAAEGRAVLDELLTGADVFHQNFTRGAAARLRLTEDDLRAHNPDIVYSSVSVHADGGFRGGYRGHEELGQAVSGMQVRLGGDGPPRRAGWAVNDYATGHLSALAILLGLYHRGSTGEAQHVQAALSRTATILQLPFMLDYRGRRWDEPDGNANGWGPLDRLYEAADGWFYMAAVRPDDLARLSETAGLPDPRELPADELGDELAAHFREENAAELVQRLTRSGIAAHVLSTVEDNMEDPVARQRGLSVRQHHPAVGRRRAVGRWARMSLTPLRDLQAAPPLGWDGRDVLADVSTSRPTATPLDGEGAAEE
jgi:crotonobetainyl-CoA:carnitine CoA-transferase CaiB-like acyl-CoA transferase